LPLAFEVNAGQSDGRVRYLARGSGYSLFLTGRGMTLTLGHGQNTGVVRTQMIGASPARVSGEHRLRGVVNVYRGRRSHPGISTYRRVRYRSLYPGIDAVVHGRQGSVEYDFEVAPGADPRRIGLAVAALRRPALASNGDLVLPLRGGDLREHRPRAYQRVGRRRIPVPVRFTLRGRHVGFRLGPYDRRRALVVDPVLSYASYLGGSAWDDPEKIAVGGPNQDIYLVGSTTSADFPDAGQPNGASDVFVTALDSTGKGLVYSTYIGGSGDDTASDIAVDGSGGAYVVGSTKSGNYPAGGFYPSPTDNTKYPAVDSCADASTNGFLTQVDATGVIDWSSCLGGGGVDEANSVAVRDTHDLHLNSFVQAYVAGDTSSADFPVSTSGTAGLHTSSGGGTDAFLTKVQLAYPGPLPAFNPCSSTPCSSIPYSTYMGGSSSDYAFALTLDSSGNAYVAGRTTSTTWTPTTPSGTAPSDYDAFIAKVNPTVSGSGSWTWGRFIGSTGVDEARAVAIEKTDGTGIVVVAGDSTSATSFPGVPSSGNVPPVAPDAPGHSYDFFVSRVASDGSAVLGSDFIGGSGDDYLHDMAWHASGLGGSMTLIGESMSSGLTTVNPIAGQSCSSVNQVLLVKYDPSALPKADYATCLGGTGTADVGTGVAVDAAGGAWITGTTLSTATTGDARQDQYGGGIADGFLAHVTQKPPTISAGPSGVVNNGDVQFTWTTDEQNTTYECTQEAGGQLQAGHLGSCGGVSANYTGLVDGPQTFEVATVDGSGDVSDPVSREFTVDTHAPGAFDLTGPDDGATTGTHPTITSTAADDVTPVTYRLMVDDKKLQDVSASACSNGVCSAQAASVITTGAHRWSVVAADSADPPHTTPSTTTRAVNVFDPPAARLTVSPNPALLGRPVTLDGSASADASHTITNYEWDADGDGVFDVSTGSSPTTTTSYAKAGTYNVGLRVTDASGATGTATVPLKVTDSGSGAGQIGVSINKGAQYTNHPDVTLTIVAPASATGLLISNDGGFAGALPQSVAGEVAWKLDSSGPERLPKTVYLRFLTGPFASPNFTDDIILDERPPVVDSASVVGGPARATAAKLRTWKVKVKAHDTNSGVGGVQVALSKRKPGKLLKYAKTVRVKLGARPKLIRAKDRAGNLSRWKKLR
jgi:hypothetical protein